MVNLGKSWILKVFMILCISLQCVALFPHHHHAGSEAVCFNIEHCAKSHSDFKDHQGCVQHKGCDGHSMQRHQHDSGRSECTANKIVVIKPQNKLTGNLMPFTFVLIGSMIPSPLPLEACNENYTGRMLAANIEDNAPQIDSIIITYISKALSMRAPNVLS